MNEHVKKTVGWAALLALLVAGVCSVRAGDLPFTDSFDNHSSTVLHNENEWQAHQQRNAQVQSTVKFAGAKAAALTTNTVLLNEFTETTATNVWVDFYARQLYPPNGTPPVITGSVAAAFFVDNVGSLKVLSNTTWVALGYTVPSNTWRRYTVNIDYAASNWAIYVADDVPNKLSTPLATNLVFGAASTNQYFHAVRIKN